MSLGDVLEWPFKTAASAIDDVVSTIPGGDWIKRAYDSGSTVVADVASWNPVGVIDIPLPTGGKISGTLGQLILLTITGNVSAALSGLATPGGTALIDRVAPALAELSWAMPQFMIQHNRCFSGAYVQAFTERFVRLLQALPEGTELGNAMTGQISRLMNDPDFLAAVDPARIQAVKDAASAAGRPAPSTAEALAQVGASPDALAGRFKVRADSVALALQLVYCGPVFDVSRFDVATGAAPFTPPPGVVDPFTAPIPPLPGNPKADDVLLAILDAQHQGATDDQVAPLEKQFLAARAAEAAAAAGPSAAAAGVAQRGLAPSQTADLFRGLASLAILSAPAWGVLYFLRRRRA